MPNLRLRRYHWHNSPKAGTVYLDSSYELKAAMILDEDSSVLSYSVHEIFYTPTGKKRFTDFIVKYANGEICLIEIKPLRRLPQYEEQIEDNKNYAASKSWEFQVWTESNLGFLSESDATAWADFYLSQIDGKDYSKIRKLRATQRVKKHYHEKIKQDMVKFRCKYCNCDHEMLRLTYDRDVVRNADWVCHMENAKRTGRLPKGHLKKINPYESEGKKECRSCKEIKEISGNFTFKDKTKGTLMLDCNFCRAAAATAKYQAKKAKSKTETTL